MALSPKEELELLELEEAEYQHQKRKSSGGVNVGDVAKSFAQGVSAGFLPRFAGALETGGQAIGIKGLGGTDLTNIELQKPELFEPEKLKQNYLEAKTAYEKALDLASQRSPIASGAAELAGGLAMPLPGGVAKTLTGKALQGAGLGAIGGYGYSREDDDKLGRMALGAGLGFAAPIVLDKAITPTIQKAGEGIGKLKTSIAKWGDQYKTMPKENVEQIINASRSLGFEPSKAMLSDSKQIAALEEGLTKGGSFVATPYIERQQAIQEGLKKATGKVSELASGKSNVAIGTELSGKLADEANRIFQPSKELYQSISKDLQNVPINKDVVNKAFGAARRNDVFISDQGNAFLDDIQAQVSKLSDVPSLMNYTRNLWKKHKPMGTVEEKDYIQFIYGTLKSIRDNSINAMNENEFVKRAGKRGAESVNEIMDNLTQADFLHQQGIKEINGIRSLFGSGGKKFSSPSQFQKDLAEKEFEKIGRQASATSFETLSKLKQNFPESFEKAKESQINDLLSRSETKGEVDLGKLVRNLRKISQEAKSLLFDKETLDNLANLETVYNSFPNPSNPSNTSGMQRMWQSFSSPVKTLQDVVASKALQEAGPKGSTFSRGAARELQKAQRALRPGGSIYEAPSKTGLAVPKVIQHGIDTDKKEPDQTSILNRVKGTPYEQVLNNAIKNGGPRSFAAANYVLKNRDNNYRSLFNDEEPV